MKITFLDKVKAVVAIIFTIDYWFVQLNKFNKTWNEIIKEIIYLDLPIQEFDGFDVTINNKTIWIENYPYSFANPYIATTDNNSIFYKQYKQYKPLNEKYNIIRIRPSLMTMYFFHKWLISKGVITNKVKK
jgi:hypothetical protein